MYGIWDCNEKDWVREFQGKAILAFACGADARERAAQYVGYDNYEDAYVDGYVEVRIINCFEQEKGWSGQ